MIKLSVAQVLITHGHYNSVSNTIQFIDNGIHLVQPEASLDPNSNIKPPINELDILTPCKPP